MRQIGPGVGVSFKWKTPIPTAGQNPDSGGLQLHIPGARQFQGLQQAMLCQWQKAVNVGEKC